jgi:uncharacterized membrane protein
MPEITIESIDRRVVVHAPVSAVFARWNRIEDFPTFMEGVREISWLNEKRFRLVSEACGKEFESICEIVLRIPDKRLAWRTLSGPDSSGVVGFEPAGEGRTEVTLKMRYNPNDGWEDREQVEQRLERNLRRFKALVEQDE